jgi:(E)-4-hydroxy-3-methylbut-2-enyl-diphosphate synthase
MPHDTRVKGARRASIPADVGGVIGGDAQCGVLSTPTRSISRARADLACAGPEIVRITVDRDKAAKAVPHIRDRLAQMVPVALGRRLPLLRPHAVG